MRKRYPPGRRTLTISESARTCCWVGMCWITVTADTHSKDSLRKGRFCTSPETMGESVPLFRARDSISNDWSIPTTNRPCFSSRRTHLPVPQPTSSTRTPREKEHSFSGRLHVLCCSRSITLLNHIGVLGCNTGAKPVKSRSPKSFASRVQNSLGKYLFTEARSIGRIR